MVAQGGATSERPALFQAKQQGPAPSIATACGINHRLGLDRGDDGFLATLPHFATVCAQSHHQATHLARYVRMAQTGAVAEHLAFVVVDGDPIGVLNEPGQLFAVEHRQALAGIKHKRNARRFELLRMLQHGIAPIGRDDAQTHAFDRTNLDLVRQAHGAWVEGGDLVVVAVGHDHRLGGVGVGHGAHPTGVDAQALQALDIGPAIVAQSSHRVSLAAQLMQAVGDVACTTAKVAAQSRHQKRHIQDVQLVGQDLLGKAPFKIHDGVKSQGSTNQRSHVFSFFKGKKSLHGNHSSGLPHLSPPANAHSTPCRCPASNGWANPSLAASARGGSPPDLLHR